jgi:hypothetical protein
MAIAAVQVGGRTIHSIFKLQKGNLTKQSQKDMSDSVRTAIKCLLEPSDIPLFMVLIDEVSTLSPVLFNHINWALQQVYQNIKPFGGIAVVLVGDFYQLPPSGEKQTLVDVLVKKYVFNAVDLNEHSVTAAELFRPFKKIELIENLRASEDPLHSLLVQKLRSTNLGEYPLEEHFFKNKVYEKYILKDEDVRNDIENSIMQAPCLVTGNFLKDFIVSRIGPNVARLRGVPFITWKKRVTTNVDVLSTDELYAENPTLYGYFVPGCGGYLIQKINNDLDLTNGTPVRMHSITLNVDKPSIAITDEDEDQRTEQIDVSAEQFDDGDSKPNPKRDNDLNSISNARPGDVIEINLPLSVNVELVQGGNSEFDWERKVSQYRYITLVPGKVVFPIFLSRMDKYGKYFHPILRRNIYLNVMHHPYELDTAATFNKAQGRTMSKVNCDLNHPVTTPYISYEHIFVWLSRVRKGNDAKIMPFTNGYEHLLKLRPANPLVIYMNSIDEDGMFDVEMAKTAMGTLREAELKLKASHPQKAKVVRGAGRGDDGREDRNSTSVRGRGYGGGRSQLRRGRGRGVRSTSAGRGSAEVVQPEIPQTVPSTEFGGTSTTVATTVEGAGNTHSTAIGNTNSGDTTHLCDNRNEIFLLQNLGVSCYVNVIIQLFRHTHVSKTIIFQTISF